MRYTTDRCIAGVVLALYENTLPKIKLKPSEPKWQDYDDTKIYKIRYTWRFVVKT